MQWKNTCSPSQVDLDHAHDIDLEEHETEGKHNDEEVKNLNTFCPKNNV